MILRPRLGTEMASNALLKFLLSALCTTSVVAAPAFDVCSFVDRIKYHLPKDNGQPNCFFSLRVKVRPGRQSAQSFNPHDAFPARSGPERKGCPATEDHVP